MWMLRPEVLASYAVHHETGERMPPAPRRPPDRVAHLQRGLRDHRVPGRGRCSTRRGTDSRPKTPTQSTDVAAFERDALAAAGLDDPLVPPRYSSTYFAHIFAGGYDAGYYSYIWSEVAGADIMAWFEANGGATRENGDRFRAEILAPGRLT